MIITGTGENIVGVGSLRIPGVIYQNNIMIYRGFMLTIFLLVIVIVLVDVWKNVVLYCTMAITVLFRTPFLDSNF